MFKPIFVVTNEDKEIIGATENDSFVSEIVRDHESQVYFADADVFYDKATGQIDVTSESFDGEIYSHMYWVDEIPFYVNP